MNAAGGINIAGKKLPVEMKVYDDQSDLDTCMRLLTKLMEEDKVDWLLGAAEHGLPVRRGRPRPAHGYILCSAEGGATTLEAGDGEGLPASLLPVPQLLQPLPDADVRGRSSTNWARRPSRSAISTTCTASNTRPGTDILLQRRGHRDPERDGHPGGHQGRRRASSRSGPKRSRMWSARSSIPTQTILTLQTMMQLDYNPKACAWRPGQLLPRLSTTSSRARPTGACSRARGVLHKAPRSRPTTTSSSPSSATRRTSTSGVR